MVKNPKKTGSWRSIGRHPPIGFTLFSFMNSMSFWFIFWGLSLYFSCSSFICGWSCDIRFIDLVLALVSGQNSILMMMVMTMIAQA